MTGFELLNIHKYVRGASIDKWGDLLRDNIYACGIVFTYDYGGGLDEVNTDFISRSGWLDYLKSFKTIDPFSYGSHGVYVRESQVFIRYCDPMHSLARAKFFQLAGTMPFELVVSPDLTGYIYLLPFQKVERLSTALIRRHPKLKSTAEFEASSSGEMTDESEAVLDEFRDDPLLRQTRYISFALSQYGISMELYSLDSDVYAYPGTDVDTPERIINSLRDNIILDTTDTANEFKVLDEYFNPENNSLLHHREDMDKIKLVDQYELPEMSHEQWLHCMRIVSRTDRMDSHTFEAMTALASLGKLTSEMDYYDVLTKFADNIGPGLPFLRYPITMFGYELSDVSDKRMLHYQSDYTSPYARRKMNLDDLEMVEDLSPPPEYVQVPDRRMDPAKELAKRRFQKESDKGYKEFIRLYPVSTDLKYFAIHGITLPAQEVVRIFHNTPLASVLEQGVSEYNPIWLTVNDAILIRDLLAGRLMPHSFYTTISMEAYINLSSKHTFLEMYEMDVVIKKYEIDSHFVLGMRMIHWLSEINVDEVGEEVRMLVELVR